MSSTSTFFFFNDTATTEIYTLSLHDALPIWSNRARSRLDAAHRWSGAKIRRRRHLHCFEHSIEVNQVAGHWLFEMRVRSEEHTSELQSLAYLVCRLLLEKKNNITSQQFIDHT